mmetsp:Transcript_26816/g.62309  ORF Transcript_26816/g.62309 Transcript_26816/m.62309 type:complete len:88 (+) Transcript_26816:71-334(+)
MGKVALGGVVRFGSDDLIGCFEVDWSRMMSCAESGCVLTTFFAFFPLGLLVGRKTVGQPSPESHERGDPSPQQSSSDLKEVPNQKDF